MVSHRINRFSPYSINTIITVPSRCGSFYSIYPLRLLWRHVALCESPQLRRSHPSILEPLLASLFIRLDACVYTGPVLPALLAPRNKSHSGQIFRDSRSLLKSMDRGFAMEHCKGGATILSSYIPPLLAGMSLCNPGGGNLKITKLSKSSFVFGCSSRFVHFTVSMINDPQ